MNRKPVIKEISNGLVATLVVFLIVEALLRLVYFARNSMVTEIPLPYVFGYDYGPIPPWLDGLRMLEPDNVLIWKNRPHIHRKYIDIFSPAQSEQERLALLGFFPHLHGSLKRNPTWEVSLNAEGFRDVEFPKEKPSSVFRIVCLGDSWTFGWNVAQNQAYPQTLQALLKSEFPEASFEVFNLGVGGYSSINGLMLLKQRVLALKPDIVALGFAMNEPTMGGVRPENARTADRSVRFLKTLGDIANKIEMFKLLRYWALLLKWNPEPINAHIENLSRDARWKRHVIDDKYTSLEPWVKDSLKDFDGNHREMIKLAKTNNINVVLLYNEFWKDSPYLKILQQISSDEGVPLVNSSALIRGAQKRIEDELQRKLDLAPHVRQRPRIDGEIEVVFRVFADKWSVPKTMYIVGNHTQLGDLVPNRIAMYDDGTHGDQKAGDHVWSYSTMFSAATTLFYVYTNSGKDGTWEGLDVPYVRRFTVEAKGGESTLFTPIESFGRVYMQADSWHTNAAGYELIAKSLLDVLKKNDRLKDYLRQAK